MMALLLLMLAATLGEAKTRDWKDAKVTDVAETIVSAASWGDTNIAITRSRPMTWFTSSTMRTTLR